MLPEACEKQGFYSSTVKASWLEMNSRSDSYTLAAVLSLSKNFFPAGQNTLHTVH